MRLLLLLIAVPLLAQDAPTVLTPGHYYVCKGDHPHCKSPLPVPYHQFSMKKMDDFAAFSEIVPPGPPIPHYQTFLAEVISQRKDSNVVALWGDGAADTDRARVWGGFLAARMSGFRKFAGDAQLRGLEVDVLNDGLPGVAPNMSKVGIEIVGFGKTNTAALNVLSEGSNGKLGAFSNALVVEKMAVDEDGTVFGIGPQKCQLGLNLSESSFKDSAILISQNNRISFRQNGKGDASIWRDDISNGHLVLTAGPSGLRVTNSENNKNLMYIHPDGSIDHASAVWLRYWPFVAGGCILMVCLSVITAYLLLEVCRLRGVVYGRNVPGDEPVGLKGSLPQPRIC